MVNNNKQGGGHLTAKNRKEIGVELRKTHFTLGNESKISSNQDRNTVSQYQNDYKEHNNGSNKYGPNMDSVTLRKTHFKLGKIYS